MGSEEVAQIGVREKQMVARQPRGDDNNGGEQRIEEKISSRYKLRRVFVAEWYGTRRNSKDRPDSMRRHLRPHSLPKH